jgi:hypothetical protein
MSTDDSIIVDDSTKKPRILVAENNSKGYVVVNKPSNIPMHKTADNAIKNVKPCLLKERQQEQYYLNKAKSGKTNDINPCAAAASSYNTIQLID